MSVGWFVGAATILVDVDNCDVEIFGDLHVNLDDIGKCVAAV